MVRGHECCPATGVDLQNQLEADTGERGHRFPIKQTLAATLLQPTKKSQQVLCPAAIIDLPI